LSTLRRFLPRIGQWTLLQVALLLLVISLVVFGLAGIVRSMDVNLLLTTGIAGALLSWLAARSRMRVWLAVLLAVALGAACLLIRVGRLEGDLLAIPRGAAVTLWQIGRWAFGGPRPLHLHLFEGPAPDWTLVPLALSWLTTDTATLLNRALTWLQALRAGEAVFDPTAAALVWGMAIWLVTVWAGWFVRRYRQAAVGLFPAGALLSYSLYYSSAHPYILLPFLGIALLLTALTQHQAREQRWALGGVDFSPDIWHTLSGTTTVVAAGLVLAALILPSLSVRNITEFLQRINQPADNSGLVESLGLEPQPPTADASFARVGLTGLPRSYLIGAPPELLRQVVMVVRTGDVRRGVAEPPVAYYWRTHTYDRYAGSGWATSETAIVEYPAGQTVISPTLPYRQTVEQEVLILGETGGLLALAGEPVAVNQDIRVAWRSGGDLFAAAFDGREYRARSLVPHVSHEQLRAASTDYPAWVSARYLPLPETVPERVLTLARDLTATAPTPYDRALAIERYLRTFPYTLDVPPPPPGRDVADYFLFDLRRGYCDEYATAMVVLARAAGLPARLVVGYTSGTYDAENARWVVIGANAHAWAEVYFPPYGWIEFEPTASRPPFERPETLGPGEWPEQPEQPLAPTAVQRTSGWCWGLLATPAALLVTLTLGLVVDRLRLRYLPPPTAVLILYERLRRWGRWVGVPMREGDTAFEFGAALEQTLEDLKGLQDLIQAYVQANYAPTLPPAAMFRQAIRGWPRLRRRLALAVLRRWLARLEPRQRLPYPA